MPDFSMKGKANMENNENKQKFTEEQLKRLEKYYLFLSGMEEQEEYYEEDQ